MYCISISGLSFAVHMSVLSAFCFFILLHCVSSYLIFRLRPHSLWFLKSVQHSIPEMFQRVVHILLISFPGVASLVPGYSRAAAASLGMWHLHVHLLGQNFPQATLACWALWMGKHVAQVYRTCMSFDTSQIFIWISYINELPQTFY